MTATRTCPNGHSFNIDPDEQATQIVCPQCGAIVEEPAASDAGRPKGLWSVIGKPQDDSANESEPSAETDAPRKGLWSVMGQPAVPTSESESDTPAEESQPAEPTPQAGKGLWALMGQPTAAADSRTETEDGSDSPRGLWSVMRSEPEPTDAAADAEPTTETATLDDEEDELEVATLEELAEEEEQETAIEEPAAPPKPDGPVAVRSSGAKKALLLGLLALPASALSMLPELWLRIPANLLGFFALMVGFMAVSEIRHSHGRLKGRGIAGIGIACGTLGMLFGPFLFTPLGEHLRNIYGRQRTLDNLTRVGDALNEYHSKNGRFPSGGTYKLAADGKSVPMHNWTTYLLPYLGEDAAALYERIDLNLPYDHAENRGAFASNVEAFQASGSSREKTDAGYAVTHFVALGGQTEVQGVGLVDIGIFGRNSKVKRDDVTDGLAQTLVAGEIADEFPAWGEPGHSRRIGKGLNKDPKGFGNADRTGAFFLRADGSVRFYSNKTDRQVLRRLSTRNGREKVDRSDY